MTDVLSENGTHPSTNGTQKTAVNMPAFRFGGMFANFTDSVFAKYAGALTWRDRIAGGTPSDPKLIEGWLKSKMPGMSSDTERRYMLVKTLRDMGAEIPADQDLMAISMDQLEEAATKVAASKGANGFKRPNRVVQTRPILDDDGQLTFDKDGSPRVETVVIHPGYLAIETRHLKAGIKEWTNILYAGTSWGKTRKSPKGFMAEHTFVNPLLDPLIIGEAVYDELTKPDPKDPQGRIPKYPDFLFLTKYNQDALATGEPMFSMITAPDDVETFIGHVSGPQGPRSNLTRVEVVSEATIHVEIMVLRDEIAHEHWPVLFLCGQENGLGAMRSQGYGRYDVTRFERTSGKYPPLDWDAILAGVDKDQVLAEYQKSKTKLQESGEIMGEETEGMVSTAAPIKGTRSRKAAVATISTDDSEVEE